MNTKLIKTLKIGFMCLLIAIVLLLPRLTNNTYYNMIFNQTLINIIVVLGLNFITGLTGQMNLGMAGFFAIGAYTSSLLSVNFGIPAVFSTLIALAVGYILGRLLGYPSLRVKGIYLALTTIGFGEIVRLLATNLSKVTGGTHGVNNIPGYNFFGLQVSEVTGFYYLLLILVVITAIIAYRIVKSGWGRAFKAVRDNAEALEACGTNIADIKIKAFTLSTVYACFAGAVYAHLMGYINPASFTFEMSVNYLIMLMIGGIGSVVGNVVGAITVTILPELLRFLGDYYWLVFSTLALISILLLPQGLITIKSVIIRKIKASKQTVK